MAANNETPSADEDMDTRLITPLSQAMARNYPLGSEGCRNILTSYMGTGKIAEHGQKNIREVCGPITDKELSGRDMETLAYHYFREVCQMGQVVLMGDQELVVLRSFDLPYLSVIFARSQTDNYEYETSVRNVVPSENAAAWIVIDPTQASGRVTSYHIATVAELEAA